jgi:hypothetical protein
MEHLWDKQQVKSFVKQAKDTVGKDGWKFIGLNIQEALIDAQVTHVLIGMIGCTVSSDDVQTLRRDMMVEAGLWEKETVEG